MTLAAAPLDVVAGQRVSVEADFRLGGVLTDPTVVTVYLRSPNAALTTLVYPTTGLTRDMQGVYRVEFTASAAGSWGVRFEGSGGGVEAAKETFVNVNPSLVV
jgi:hypothetical protein